MSLHVSFFTIDDFLKSPPPSQTYRQTDEPTDTVVLKINDRETMKLKELLTNRALRWIIEKLHFQKYFHYFSGVVKVSCDTGDCVLIVLNRRSTSCHVIMRRHS